MLADEDQSLREKAVEKIWSIQKGAAERLREVEERGKQDQEEEEKEEEEEEEEAEEEVLSLHPEEQEAIDKANIRKFVVPKINFKAKSYPDLIDWETAKFSEPPLTASFSDQDLSDLIRNPLVIPFFPCHTQPVERAIKLVTEAASTVMGMEAQDSHIRRKIRSRKENFRFVLRRISNYILFIFC